MKMEQPWLNGNGDGFAPSEPRFNSRWYSYESSVAAGKASGQNCSGSPVKVPRWYLRSSLGMAEPSSNGVNDVYIRTFSQCKRTTYFVDELAHVGVHAADAGDG